MFGGAAPPPGARTRQVRLAPLQPAAARPSRLWTTRAAAEGFFHDAGVRGMLHDFASELALCRPEDPRKFLYAKLQRELAAEEEAEEDSAARAPALHGQTDSLRVHTECRAGGRLRRGYFVQRAPPQSCPRLDDAAGGAPAASTRLVSWETEALAAVKRVVRETAGLEAAGPESAVATSDAAAAPVPEGAQAQLDEAEEAILGFWLIRGGGGAGGDRALATEFFETDNEALDAPQLEARLLKVLGVYLDPAQSAQLLARLLSVSACEAAPGEGPAVLSAQALQEWVRQRYPRFELEQLLQSDGVQLHKILARHLARGTGPDAAHTRDEVLDCVRAAAVDIADAVHAQIAQADAARRAAQTGGANGKFAGDDLGGTFEGKFASAQAFHGGLDRHVGLPNQNVLEAVISEHKYARNASTPYKTSNYGLTCTPEEELVRRRLPRARALLPRARARDCRGFWCQI